MQVFCRHSSARMPARSSFPNSSNTLTKGGILTQVELVYGNGNRMSLLAGNVVATAVYNDELSMVSIHFDVSLPEM